MKKLITLLTFLCAASAQAAVVTSGPVELGNIQIIDDANPRVYLGGVTLDGTALGCDNNIPVILLNTSRGALMYETLLSAKKAGQKVNLVASKCWDIYSTPIVYSIYTH
ncbi:hypothetical protein [Pseudoalteromonas sp. '520P1 No. 412']|nr:hypothetical protein [Pseudoalteromonas sp. '520P1 No. 412']